MKTVLLTLLRFVFLPFLLIGFGLKYWSLVHKAKRYINKKDQDPFMERLERVFKLVRFYLYLRGISVQARFSEKLPTRRPVLIVANHKSFFDPLVLIYAIFVNKKQSETDNQGEREPKFPFTFVAKIELKKRSAGKILSYIDCVFLDRSNLRQAFECLREQNELIKKNISICVFPEGTRIYGDELGEFKPGAIKVALKNLVPILPVSIFGTDKLDKHSKVNFFRIVPHRVYVQFDHCLNPFAYAEANPEFLVNNIKNKIYIMYEKLKEHSKVHH